MRVFVVGGSPAAQPPRSFAPDRSARVIAADRGAQHARAWGWSVHLLVGDLDSLPSPLADAFAADGTPMITAPREKDATDMELALAHALAAAPDEIIICGALGGRTDHLLANVLLLARPDLAGPRVVLADGAETIRLLRGPAGADAAPARLMLVGAPGDLVSLLPLGGDAEGVSTRGLRYPLHDETLFWGRGRGVSNVLDARQAEVSLRRGLLLVCQISVHVTDDTSRDENGNADDADIADNADGD